MFLILWTVFRLVVADLPHFHGFPCRQLKFRGLALLSVSKVGGLAGTCRPSGTANPNGVTEMRIPNPKTILAFIVCGFVLVTQSLADGWQDGGGEAWEKLFEAAKAEGKVVISGPAILKTDFIEAFEKDTGIEVLFFTGGRAERRTRYIREVESGKPTIDIFIGGLGILGLKEKGLLASQKSMIILPDALDGEKWPGGKIPFADIEQEFMPLPMLYATGRIIVNTDKIDPASIKNWRDLLRPEFKGKIASHDPRPSGPGQAVASYLVEALGSDFVEDLYKGQDVKLTRDFRQLVDWVARGTYPIAAGAVAWQIERYRDEGIKHIAVLELEDAPGYLVGGLSVTTVPENAPHPNAAAVFINWYLSARGQQIHSDIVRVPSQRTDVTPRTSPPYTIPDPNKNYFNQYDERWYSTARPKIRKWLIELLGE